MKQVTMAPTPLTTFLLVTTPPMMVKYMSLATTMATQDMV